MKSSEREGRPFDPLPDPDPDCGVLPTRRGCFDSLRSLSMTGRCVSPTGNLRAGGATWRGIEPEWRTLMFGAAAGVDPNDKLSSAFCGRDARTTMSDDFVSSSRLRAFALAAVRRCDARGSMALRVPRLSDRG